MHALPVALREQSTPPIEPLVDEKTAAHLLGVSVEMLVARRFRGNPLIPHVQVGRAIRYEPADIRAFRAKNRRCAPAAQAA